MEVDGCSKYARMVGNDFHSLSRQAQMHLQGNAMHLLSLSAWLAYVHSHCLRRCVVREFLPSLKVFRCVRSGSQVFECEPWADAEDALE